MSTFQQYARCYDLLYKNKEYAVEAAWVEKIADRNPDKAPRLLDLGSGTGRYAIEFAGRGYSVVGVDISADMVELARERAVAASFPDARLSFEVGDIRTYRSPGSFDLVTALFHVINYQTESSDVLSSFNTAASHLSRGGVFVFDSWHGPAVLAQMPEAREKVVEDDSMIVRRRARPVMEERRQIVEVNYDFEVTQKANGKVDRFSEVHRMRYLFFSEVEILLGRAGFQLQSSHSWLESGAPDETSWSACYVAVKL